MSCSTPREGPVRTDVGAIDPGLLERVRAYLEARRHRVVPAPENAEAWGRFFPLCDRLIARGVDRWLSSEADRRDAIQEAWSELVDRLRVPSAVPIPGRFEAWVVGLARHKAQDVIRRRARRPADRLSDEVLSALGDDRSIDPAVFYERERLRLQVQEALRELSRQVSTLSYQVFYAHWLEGRTMADIGLSLGMSAAQARFRNHRATRKMRRLLREVER
jgi:RNA polymerase sigma factor (sigma-70 family)